MPHLRSKPRIVLLGMLSRHPVAGIVWLTMQYLVGFHRLGCDVYYVDAHGAIPRSFMEGEDDGREKAAAFIDGVMRHFGLPGRWAYQAVHSDGACYGMSESELANLYRSADLIINLHGATMRLPDYLQKQQLVYLGTDPVEREIALHDQVPETVEFIERHGVLFTWATNYGRDDCKLPVFERYPFVPTLQPIVLDFWHSKERNGAGDLFTTIGSWRQMGREVQFQGETFHWSKHLEFAKFINLPRRTKQAFELALAGYNDRDRERLESRGWRVRDAGTVSQDVDVYRRYIADSRAEFTVAKDQNVRLRTGWFSDRSASYLAAGRPVITQETGFSNVLPAGQGLFVFSTMEEILEALESIHSAYSEHCRAAASLAREYFAHDVVLTRLLAQVGVEI